jgi:AcrR family transcriptional regulator
VGVGYLAGMASTTVRPGRVALMRTAISLMGEHGYEGTSTRDIASAAGVSVAALYYHFPSKLDLLREFLHEAHDVVLARVVRDVEAAGDDHAAQLDAAVAALIWSSLHDAWARRATVVAWRELGRLAPTDRKAVARKRDATTALIERIVAEGAASGTFTSRDPAASARAILTLCVSVVDPLSDAWTSLSETIATYQRLSRALADA